MRWTVIIALLFSMLFALPESVEANKVGIVKKVKGVVKCLESGTIKKVKVKCGDQFQQGDMLMTYGSASALLELYDGSQIVLDEGAMIRFAGLESVEQKEGAVYYDIIRRNSQSGLKITTPFAIIGIKGTTFIVNADEHPNITLKEGVIGIESLKEEFELHRKKVLQAYERFKTEQEMAFDAYKKAQDGHIIEYVKAFELRAGSTVYFDEQRADELPMSDANEKQFEHFEQLINSFK